MAVVLGCCDAYPDMNNQDIFVAVVGGGVK